jgi:hypothetical protein
MKLLKGSWLSLLILLLGLAGAVLLQIPIGWRAAIGVVAVVAAYIARNQIGARVSAIEASRYAPLRPGTADRIAACISAETPQTLTINAESGSDIDDVVAVLKTALESKKWVITKIDHGALWDGGKGIQVYYAERAAAAGKALIAAIKAENLPVSGAGDTTDGLPMRIAVRHP